MVSLWSSLEPLLDQVQRPARYIGGEEGARPAPHGPGKVAWLLCYPDSYEIGLPNQGLQILYEILNERADAVAERAYAPWVDLEALMRRDGLPLFSVDTHRPAGDFDVLAFNLSSELVYTNVLNLIDLAGVAVRAADRAGDDLLVGAGGHCAFNPEPLADFVDFFVLGDGEEAVGEITEAVAAHRAGGRRAVLGALAAVDGVYVPAAYEVGLANHVVPSDEVLPTALAIAHELAALPPVHVQVTKRQLMMARPRPTAYQITIDYPQAQQSLFALDDTTEAAAAFAEKRKPVFKGR